MRAKVRRAPYPLRSVTVALVNLADAAVVLLSLGQLQTNWTLAACMWLAMRQSKKQIPQPVKEA